MIVIVDYGLGNIRSVYSKLKNNNINVTLSSDPEVIHSADKLLFLGVGHFKKGMKNLHNLGLVDVLEKKVLIEKVPTLGICLGMHLFADYSEEGDCSGLGWIDGNVIKFNFERGIELKIPHVGWNEINIIKKDPVLDRISDKQLFYFTHSYHFSCSDNLIIASTKYGGEFPSIIRNENIIGTQFHPEKSHRKGFNLLLDFCRI